MRNFLVRSVSASVILAAVFSPSWMTAVTAAAEEAPIRILFLGDNGHHRPGDRAAQLMPVLAKRGIDVRYTDEVSSLTPETLNKFDGLMIYANIAQISPEQEKALLDYVASGKGFIPLHCATYCFLNSPKYVALCGAQFQKHGGEEFSTIIERPQHPIMKGFGGFRSWDETYVHHRHNEKDRVVLEYREQGMQADGKTREPWTWVRTHGKGRVFYTAWGHDQRTWSHPGFHNLVERGVRWACQRDPSVVPAFADPTVFPVPELTEPRTDVEPFKYVDVGPKIPNYTAGKQWGTQGEAYSKMQLPLPPEESIKHYRSPKGFELKLYASEKDFESKPIAMNWDERGRLWLCETLDYPNELQPAGQGRDRVRICEDTDGDLVADKFTVFAEGLSIPTAIVHYRGGAIVQNGVETLFLKDTDGDDKADVRKVLISNWTLGDTHGGVSNFQYGLDNWIWGMQGYNFSEPIINGEKQQGFRMGFFRFRLSNEDPPRVEEIEFVRSTNNNTWGIGIAEDGVIFGSTANHNPSVYMPIPNRYYERVRGWGPKQLGTIADTYLFDPVTDKVRQVDQHGGYTAGAGHALYTARVYPSHWWNRTAFVCGPTGHLVGTFVLRAKGADFESSSPFNLVASDDEWAAPIMAEVGPDGNVWVLDWYNYIVQHNPTPRGFKTGKGNAYESDLRDKRHGRIYRVTYPAGETESNASPGTLEITQATKLVEALRHPTMLWRKHAQRLLVERGETDVVPQLVALIKDESVDSTGLNAGAVHAIGALAGLRMLDGGDKSALDAVHTALSHPSGAVRRMAVTALPSTLDSSIAAILHSGVTADSNSQVKLAAMLALSDAAENGEAGAAVADAAAEAATTEDRWLNDAITSAAASHPVGFLKSIAQFQSPRSLATVRIVAEHVARAPVSTDTLNNVVGLLQNANAEVAESVLTGLVAGWNRDNKVELSDRSEAVMVKLLETLSPGGKGQLIRLASLTGSDALEAHAAALVRSFLEAAANAELNEAQRVSAARQLVSFRPADNDVVAGLLSSIGPQTSPAVAIGILDALGGSRASRLGAELAASSSQLTPTGRKAAIRVLLSRPSTTGALLKAIEGGALAMSDLALDQKQSLGNHPDEKIRKRAVALLKTGGGLPDANREKVLRSLMPLTEQTGDVSVGKEVFKKQCSKCHMHSGEGQRIGPDLTGMAVHPKHELLTHIIDPSRSVEGNFRMYTVVTDEGKLFNGMLAGESRTTVELVDTEAKRHVIQRADIDEMIASRKSVMPEGFEKQVSKDELASLLEFLTSKGRFVPIPFDKVATAISTKGLFSPGDDGPDRMVFPKWGMQSFEDVPYLVLDPRGKTTPNIILLNGPNGTLPPSMPKSVTLPCNSSAVALHLLSGVSGWGHPYERRNSVSMTVRLRYADGETEDHPLRNGIEFADYIRRVDVPGSKFAFALGGQQIRQLTVKPKRELKIETIELVKGADQTAPIVMAVTIERPE